jgi:hypothetical protein
MKKSGRPASGGRRIGNPTSLNLEYGTLNKRVGAKPMLDALPTKTFSILGNANFPESSRRKIGWISPK